MSLLAIWLRHRRERALHRRRLERAERRETRLENAGVARTQCDRLTAYVDLARRIDRDEADRLDLDGLLDMFVEVSIAARWQYDERRCAALIALREDIAELVRLSVASVLLPEIDELVESTRRTYAVIAARAGARRVEPDTDVEIEIDLDLETDLDIEVEVELESDASRSR